MEMVHEIERCFMGVDASKSSLDVHVLAPGGESRRRSFANDEQGVERLVAWLGADARRCRAMIEATSRYHRLCERRLRDAGVQIELLNPRRARSLADGLGLIDKDDKVDAYALARAAGLLEAKDREVPPLSAQDLRDHSRAIDRIKREAADFKKRQEGLDKESAAYQALQLAYEAMRQLALAEEKKWLEAAKQEPETYRRYTLAHTVPNVGHVTSRIVSVELPWDLRGCLLRKLVGYAGLAPRRNQSGNKELPARIQGGNPWLRTGLYMAALTAIHARGRRFGPFYEHLVARPYVIANTPGGRIKKAHIAVMRKLLTNILAVILRDSPWTEEQPKREPKTAVPSAQIHIAA